MNSIQLFNAIKAIKAKQAEAMAEGRTEDALRMDGRIEALNEQLEAALAAEDAARVAPAKQVTKKSGSAFMDYLRHGIADATLVKESTDADGGYAVPEEQSGEVRKFEQDGTMLETLVDFRTTGRDAGRMPFIAKATGAWSQLTEGATASAGTTPGFSAVSYAVKKYGAPYPVSSEWMDDTDASAEAALFEWMGEKARITKNAGIIGVAASFTGLASAITSVDDLKKVVNVVLADYENPTIVTNASGFNWLDTLKKSADSKEYLLNPDNADKRLYWLNVGSRQVPIVYLTDAELPNDTTTHSGHVDAPFYIADWKQAVMLVQRRGYFVKRFADGYADCDVLYPRIRFDVKAKDAEAGVKGYVQLS